MKPLLVFALEQESQDAFGEFDVLYTGVGKVNATHAMMKYLQTGRPEMVINIGTAGSRKFPGGSIISCTSFVQRDMDVTPLGFERFQTPFSHDPVKLVYGSHVGFLPEGVCGTGDNFDVSDVALEFDVVDMEGYALALICQREKIPFMCVKYVSDGADEGAHKDWNAALHHAAQRLREVIVKIV